MKIWFRLPEKISPSFDPICYADPKLALRDVLASEDASFLASCRLGLSKTARFVIPGPDTWAPNRTAPEYDWLVGDIHFEADAQPVGVSTFYTRPYDFSAIRKSPVLWLNEIESAIREGDVTAQEVQKVMALAPEIPAMIKKLEDIGATKAIDLIYALLR